MPDPNEITQQDEVTQDEVTQEENIQQNEVQQENPTQEVNQQDPLEQQDFSDVTVGKLVETLAGLKATVTTCNERIDALSKDYNSQIAEVEATKEAALTDIKAIQDYLTANLIGE